ncbi:hypothetical protein C4G81_RS22445 [Vibrio parahaemolyticus]|uniref:hypothetical protein n=1 Tax=Vibrio crassostreae TaxID=246167 RepID=UPI001B31848D|nr:hypothetical protein [Vibrio crassostreae]EJG0692384.1 hypothetical protein [Vibrio parahaemolyticus]
MGWFEKYQTFVAGLIGFAGVMATIRANNNQQRAQLIEEKRHERRALRRALIEELRLISEAYMSNMQDLSESTNYPIAYIPSTPHIQAFNQSVPKFGLLTTNEIKKTMRAYQLIQELPDKLRLFQTMDESVHKENFIAIDSDSRLHVVTVYDSMLSPVVQAIESLESCDKTS